jgi:outer membrane protein assembly factor BamB
VAGASTPTGVGPGTEFRQFLGPERNASVPGIRLIRDWKASPPVERWRVAVGAGWSGFAVSGSFAVTQGQYEATERVVCRELTTGAILWSHGDPVRFSDPLGGPGPRATPTIDGDRVYTLGATGILNALRLATGESLWSRNVLQEHEAPVPIYGFSISPLIHGERVLILAGGPGGHSLVAYDKVTGQPLWAAGDDPAGYSSPFVARLDGIEQIVVMTAVSVVGHDLQNGALLWRQPWPEETQMVAQPVVVGEDRLFVSTGYGVGARLFRIAADGGNWSVETLWESLAMKAKLSDLAYRDGVVYGLDDGILAAVDVETGRRMWKGGRHGHGQLLLVDDLLLIQAEGGDLVLVEAVRESYRELARTPALDRKSWNHPALAGGYLLLRNDREAVCFELELAKTVD